MIKQDHFSLMKKTAVILDLWENLCQLIKNTQEINFSTTNHHKLHISRWQTKIIFRKRPSSMWRTNGRGPMDCRSNGLSDQWTVGPMDCVAFESLSQLSFSLLLFSELSDQWTVGPMDSPYRPTKYIQSWMYSCMSLSPGAYKPTLSWHTIYMDPRLI